MSLKSLSDYTLYAKYSHYLPEKKRRETWPEIVDRVFGMHEKKFQSILKANPEFKEEFEFAKRMVRKKRVLGSQRALQFGGKWVEKEEFKIYNCSSTYIDRPRVFQEAMYTLLCGVGLGFSIQKYHTNKLPRLIPIDKNWRKFKVLDSIEGWADAIGVIINSYFPENESEFPECSGYKVIFDYSEIRPEGALIAGQFKAPGPKGLEKAVEKIRALIEKRLNSPEFKMDKFEGRLRPIDCYDILMYASDAVLSGGVRRSATLCMFDSWDVDMMNAKVGNWFTENPQRARSNNSAVLIKGKTTQEEFHKLMESTKDFGEPGFVWVEEGENNGNEIVYNPCQPGWAPVLTRNGVSTIDQISIGDDVWSASGWTKVTNKWSTGIKPVYKWTTDGYSKKLSEYSYFVGTKNHRVVSNGEKIEIDNTLTVDFFDDNSLNDITLGQAQLKNCDIKKIEYIGKEEVFDITVDNESHTYWTGGLNVSNCCEIGMRPQTEEGASGIQTCNLTEINGKFCTTEDDFLQSCRASAIIGTLQAAYTRFNYLTETTKKIIEREALLGCSITGFMDNPDILLSEEIQKKGAEEIKKTNEKIAKMIGINPSARVSCVKPAGSTSSILGTASGIHPHHAKRYIRRVQANRNEFPAQLYKDINPLAVEKSVWSSNETDEVVSFLCEVPRGAILKNSISAIEFLEFVRKTQENWVEGGVNAKNGVKPYIRHNVSVTTIVKPDEWLDVENYIFKHQKSFAGISLLPSSGDLDYQQAPFATVLTPEEIVETYGDASVFASGLIVDGLAAFDNNLWKACDCSLGIGEILATKMEEPMMPVKNGYTFKEFNKKLIEYYTYKDQYEGWFSKKDWVRRLRQFAKRYFNGDDKKATYCLKHVALWKTWVDIAREHKEIDWSSVVEEQQSYVNADTLGAQACAGGACSLI